jgi:hypothetical protein
MPGGKFVICSVCGYSLDAPGSCPACGSDNNPPEIDTSSFEHADHEERETEIIEIQEEENPTTLDESTVSIAPNPIMLPFGIGDAPRKSAGLTIPYGLDFAPSSEKN